MGIPGTDLALNAPDDGKPIVLVVETGQGPSDIISDDGYVTESLRSAGLGTVRIDSDPGEFDQDVRSAVAGIGELSQFVDTRVGLLVAGHGAVPAWELLRDPPASVRAAVLMNVPGEAGLDFADTRSVAVLSLNVQADSLATDSHHFVHEGMADHTVTHQVITYGNVGPLAFSPSSPDFDKATADDAKARATEWLEVRDGVMNQEPSTGD